MRNTLWTTEVCYNVKFFLLVAVVVATPYQFSLTVPTIHSYTFLIRNL